MYREAMKHFRTTLLLLLACKPVAESQTVQQPRQTGAPIPATVSAARRTPVVVVAHNVLPSVVNIQTEGTIRRREISRALLARAHSIPHLHLRAHAFTTELIVESGTVVGLRFIDERTEDNGEHDKAIERYRRCARAPAMKP